MDRTVTVSITLTSTAVEVVCKLHVVALAHTYASQREPLS
jgi:hypothetical protein